MQALIFPQTVDFFLYLKIPNKCWGTQNSLCKMLVRFLQLCLSVYQRIIFPLLLKNTVKAIRGKCLTMKEGQSNCWRCIQFRCAVMVLTWNPLICPLLLTSFHSSWHMSCMVSTFRFKFPVPLLYLLPCMNTIVMRRYLPSIPCISADNMSGTAFADIQHDTLH